MYADREEEALARRRRSGARRRRDSRSVSPVSPVSRRSMSPSHSPPASRSYRSSSRRDSHSRRSPSQTDDGLTRERELQEQLRRRALRSRRPSDRRESTGDREEFRARRSPRRPSPPTDRTEPSINDSPSSSWDGRHRRDEPRQRRRRSSRDLSDGSDDERYDRHGRRRPSPFRGGYYDRPPHGPYDRYAPPMYPRAYPSSPRRQHRRPPPRMERERAPRSPVADDYDVRSVFCSQLAARLSQRDLGEFFEEKLGAGTVLDVRIVMDKITGRSKGVGYVELNDEALVGQAIGLSGTPLYGIPVVVQRTEAARKASTSQSNGQAIHIDPAGVPSAASRLYVGNLHFSLSEADIRSIFEPFGAIVAVDLHREPGSQKSKGFAFVQFANADVADKAIEHMDGFELAGRNIKVGHVNAVAKAMGEEHAASSGAGVSMNSAALAAMEAAGATATLTSSFDEGGGGGLTAVGRVALMEMLARTDAKKDGRQGQAAPQEQHRPASIPQSTSRGVLLKNMFSAEEETGREWHKELADDVREECEASYGKVDSIKVDTDSASGEIWIRFVDVDGARKAIEGLNGRFFAGRSVSAAYISEGFLATVLG